MMAAIERVEIRMVDLKPKVKRVDAMQSFVSQETPIVRITDADGAAGVGYCYTIGAGGHSIVELLSRSLCPALIGREAGMVEQIWRDLYFLTHATSVGAITSLALAAIDTALWDLRSRKAGLPLHVMAGGARDKVRLYTTEGAGCTCLQRRWSRTRLKRSRPVSAAPRSRSVDRPVKMSRDWRRCGRRSGPPLRSSLTLTKLSPSMTRSAGRPCIRPSILASSKSRSLQMISMARSSLARND
jgi:L-alanine-DL-glutamate epimerase-like enolase superfamily enzyme